MNIREIDKISIKKIGIYCITNLVNGKKYVGRTLNKRGFNFRWKVHYYNLVNNLHKNKYLQNAFNKYGIDKFEFSIIEIVERIDDKDKLNQILNEREQYWIKYYNTYNSDNGYNMTKGGEGLIGVFHESGEKNKSSKKIVRVNLDFKEYKIYNYMSEAKNEGFSLPKISCCCHKKQYYHKNYFWFFYDDFIKLTNKNKQIYIDKYNDIKKFNFVPKGNKHYMFNKKALNVKSILQLDKNYNIVNEYNSIKEAKIKTMIYHIDDCLCGNRKTAGGFIWKYKK